MDLLAPSLPAWHVEVKFGKAVDADTQGRLMLAWERLARETMKIPVELYKATAADDLKRRRELTDAERKRL